MTGEDTTHYTSEDVILIHVENVVFETNFSIHSLFFKLKKPRLTSSDAPFLKTTKLYTYFKLHNSLKNVCPDQTQKSFIIKFLPLYIFSTVMSELSTHIFFNKNVEISSNMFSVCCPISNEAL